MELQLYFACPWKSFSIKQKWYFEYASHNKEVDYGLCESEPQRAPRFFSCESFLRDTANISVLLWRHIFDQIETGCIQILVVLRNSVAQIVPYTNQHQISSHILQVCWVMLFLCLNIWGSCVISLSLMHLRRSNRTYSFNVFCKTQLKVFLF